MAHKTFISYKYSEARDLRDKIIDALGEDSSYYKGETSESPNMDDLNTETIKKNLCDMMYDTSVTIVIISPNMKDSKWIDWEINYCLRKQTRKGRTSQRNGIVGVIMKFNGSYDWIKSTVKKSDGCSVSYYDNSLMYDIINKNRSNQNPKRYNCDTCRCIDRLSGSYISLIEEDEFLSNPTKFINNAFDKSENDASGYEISLS